jgi:hypothetical protein
MFGFIPRVLRLENPGHPHDPGNNSQAYEANKYQFKRFAVHDAVLIVKLKPADASGE